VKKDQNAQYDQKCESTVCHISAAKSFPPLEVDSRIPKFEGDKG